MQSTTTTFRQLAAGHVRPLTWQLRMSFDKAFDDTVSFFTLNDSVLNGVDVLKTTDGDNVMPWDQYAYINLSDRVISLEVTNEEVEPYSMVQSIADITLNNYDNYFTPNSGSPIDQYILPKRPVRIYMGFGLNALPQFVGLTEKMPEIDEKSKTVTFHAVDFLSYILDREIDQTVMLEGYSTSQILEYLFGLMGLLPTQYVVDDTSFNVINYFAVEKGTKFQSIVRDLMEAEQGRLYMDELGVIRFLNRQNYSTTSQYTFSKRNVNNYSVSNEDDVINYVKLTCNVLEEQPEQSIYEQSERVYIPAGTSKTIWVSTNDPITDATQPVYSATDIQSSHYISTVDSDGVVPYTDIVVDSMDVFSTAVKLVFENVGLSNGYVYSMDLWGTPVKVVDTIIVEDSDPTSIADLELRPYTFETKYIQDRNAAISKAAIMINDYKDYGSILDIETKGTTALQIGDTVTLDLDGYQGQYIITKKYNALADAKLTQRLRVKFKEAQSYFILSSDTVAKSLLGGSEVLLP